MEIKIARVIGQHHPALAKLIDELIMERVFTVARCIALADEYGFHSRFSEHTHVIYFWRRNAKGVAYGEPVAAISRFQAHESICI